MIYDDCVTVNGVFDLTNCFFAVTSAVTRKLYLNCFELSFPSSQLPRVRGWVEIRCFFFIRKLEAELFRSCGTFCQTQLSTFNLCVASLGLGNWRFFNTFWIF